MKSLGQRAHGQTLAANNPLCSLFLVALEMRAGGALHYILLGQVGYQAGEIFSGAQGPADPTEVGTVVA